MTNSENVAVLPHGICHAPPDNREITVDSVADLLASMSERGMLVPVLAYPHPEIEGHLMLADGARRLFCARILNIDVKAVLLPRAPSDAEKIAIRLTVNGNRKEMEPGEVGADLYAYIVASGCSQEELAQQFQISPPMVSKLLAPFVSGVPQLIEALKARQIPLTAAPMIAKLPPEVQVEILPQCLGQKRVVIEAVVKKHQGKKAPQPKQVKVQLGKGTVLVTAATVPELKAQADALIRGIARLEKEGWGVAMLPNVLTK